MLADAKSVAGMLLNAGGGGGLSGGPTATSSFPADVTSNALREGLLGEELVLLRKQVGKIELMHCASQFDLRILETAALVPHLVSCSHIHAYFRDIFVHSNRLRSSRARCSNRWRCNGSS